MKTLSTPRISSLILRKLHIPATMCLIVVFGISIVSSTYAAKNFNFLLTINPNILTVDIVNGTYTSVTDPVVSMNAISTSFACQSTPGVLGTAEQQIYVRNPDAADNGWTMTLAGATPTASWVGTGGTMDFNDPTTAGCTDGADTDTLKGQLAVNPSVGTLAAGACTNCVTTGITKGTAGAFIEDTGNSITILTAASESDDFGDWALQGVTVSQTIPAEQVAAADYALGMVLSVVAS